MADSDTLLAHLVPSITSQVEVAATKALAYILDNSASARKGLLDLVENTVGARLESVTRFVAEDAYKTNGGEVGRVDFAGYDHEGKRRVVGEAKFGAALSPGQGSGYLGQLEKGNSVLLFVVPDYRIDHLWEEVRTDVEGGQSQWKLGQTKTQGRIKSADVEEHDGHLMMVSWQNLLLRMQENASGETQTQADIQQLLGLTERLDRDAVLPFGKEDLSPHFGRRMRDLRIIYDDVISRIRKENWVTAWYGTSRYPQSAYGQFCQISGVGSWFGVYYRLWARGDCEETPFWLEVDNCPHSILAEIDNQLNVKTVNNKSIPIRLKLGVERQEIVDSIVDQLVIISQIIREAS